jgi:putative hydrolase of HD superfamily
MGASGKVESNSDQEAVGLAQFAFEMGVLKRLRRSGWWHAGIRDPESVAEHSLRVSQLAALISAQEGADPAREAVAEYEAQATPEARCARDADKLECLLQAIEYRAAGNTGVQGWIDSSRNGLTTSTAQRIADAALTTSPLAWRGR